jgi:membrane fusion protein, heavy metal efflux system
MTKKCSLKLTILKLTAISALVSVVACDQASPPAATQPAKISAPKVEGDTITFVKDSPQLATLATISAVQEQEGIVRINGRTGWDDTRTVKVLPPVSGRVVEILAVPGSTVKKGSLLAIITSAEFGLVQSEARKSETDLLLSEKQLQRAKDLALAGVIAQKELQSAEADFARAKGERQRTLSRERAFGGSGAALIDQKFQLISPIAGVVVDRRIFPGQEVRADQTNEQPLFTITEPSKLWVTLDVPEALTQEIQVGELVRIAVPSLPNEIFNARVEYVADFIDAQSRTVKARAAVDNSQRRLKAEMYVNAEVQIPPSKAMKVPSNAVFVQGEKYHAFVESPAGVFTRRTVKAEEASIGYVRVTAGIDPGDRVLTDGALLLQQLLNAKATAPATKAVKQ